MHKATQCSSGAGSLAKLFQKAEVCVWMYVMSPKAPVFISLMYHVMSWKLWELRKLTTHSKEQIKLFLKILNLEQNQNYIWSSIAHAEKDKIFMLCLLNSQVTMSMS